MRNTKALMAQRPRHGVVVVALCAALAGCAIRDLANDLEIARATWGYLKGEVVASETDSLIVVGLFDATSPFPVNLRVVRAGEPFYFLVERSYAILAFEDLNGDFAYQTGEPVVEIDDPHVNWFAELSSESVDLETLRQEPLALSRSETFGRSVDFDLERLRQEQRIARNYLAEADWDDVRFAPRAVRTGMWQPVAFERTIGFGLYLTEAFDPGRRAVLLVHGINSSPLAFRSLVPLVPREYQVLLFHYPSGYPLDYTSAILADAVESLLRRYSTPSLDIVAHSMGGLVSQGMLHRLHESLRPKIRNHITLATPFGGHSAAELGVSWSPAVAPVWRAMLPQSEYLRSISPLGWDAPPRHYLLFAMSRETDGESRGDDGVVTVKSQLAYSAQRGVTEMYGIADEHTKILSNQCTHAILVGILNEGSGRAAVADC
jgi:pimeloyl-ACP methyl ester carboxylesterase